MTPLGLLNFLVCQWFFVRVGRMAEPLPDGRMVTTGYCLMWGIVPLTGWWSDYKRLPLGQ